ncbi:hypothetical protein [Peribacillus kribbensis]|uniref:hypothetical protein n=1 Tax=Peribacillus kribbensis TaxID=356658 RepID=UPI0009D6ACC9|nr:hypothetical protein [Peribacillus kribbensis]
MRIYDRPPFMMSADQDRFTSAGTDIEEVKKLNAESGLTYNEVEELLARQYQKEKLEQKPDL